MSADATLPAQAFARALLTGRIGFALFHDLSEQFPAITRQEVFWGCALAWTDREAALVAAEVEIRTLRRQLEHREAA